MRGDAARAIAAGFDGYLSKPARPHVLRQVMGTILKGDAQGHALVTRHTAAEAAAALAGRVELPAERLEMRVLLAEDNTVNQRVAMRMLEGLGCRVDVAATGSEAIDLWTRCPYGVILMDCQMPELDGHDATRMIRRRERSGHHLPIIALTANAMEGDRERCLEAGMDDYIAKPVSREKLAVVLKGLPTASLTRTSPLAGAASSS